MVKSTNGHEPLAGRAVRLAESVAVKAGRGKAASSILQFAEHKSVDLIVLASHGRSGVDRWLMGSVAEKIVRESDVPVLVVKAAAAHRPGLRRLLVPMDGSALAEGTLTSVEAFGRIPGNEVTLLYVEPVPELAAAPGAPALPGEHNHRDVVAYLESMVATLDEAGLTACIKVRTGNPGEQIVEEAREGEFDLVVMSSHGRTGYLESAFGSAADRLVRASPVSVLLLRADGANAAPRHLQGPMVFRCEECGRRTLRESVNELDRCSRCHRHLKTCANCVFFDGVDCAIHHLEGNTYPEVGCEQFKYRETPEVLR
jgi:nucleotide-binding universal stress UspA family protein